MITRRSPWPPGRPAAAGTKGIGKSTLYAQLDLGQADAYRLAVEVMAATDGGAREGIAAFLEKRPPSWRR